MDVVLSATPEPKHTHQNLFGSVNYHTDAPKKQRSLLIDRFIPKKLNFDTFVYRKSSDDSNDLNNTNRANLNECLKRKQSLEKYQTELKKNLSSEGEKGKILNYFDNRRRK